MTECVAVLDGYHMEIATPPKKEVKNVKSYFSGHYQMYGINIQAVCDHNCRFLFIGVGGPGVMGDREAIKESGLYDLVEKLPGLLYCIGDCAYTPLVSSQVVQNNVIVVGFDSFHSTHSQHELIFHMSCSCYGDRVPLI